jgi:hypothetical protein
MAFGDSDLGIFFADMGVPVTFGANTANGIFDALGEDIVFGNANVSGVKYSVRLPFNAFTVMPKVDDTLLIGGATYKIRNQNPIRDGKVFEYLLKVGS